MIKPTIGRVVWFWPSIDFIAVRQARMGFAYDGEGPCAALIAKVHSDQVVNLAVFDQKGTSHAVTSCELVQEGDPPVRSNYSYCEWMPYQKGQAAKTEALEAMVPQKPPAGFTVGDAVPGT